MQAHSPAAHLGFALALIVLLTLVFTFLPFRLPAPEPLSPWVYLTSSVVCLIALILIKKAGGTIWLYIPLLLLSVFGFLEETSYGVESGTVQPIYSETYNVEIYDVHNLLPVLQQIFTKDFQPSDLNQRMSSQFWRADGYLFLGLLVFGVIVQRLTQKAKPGEISTRIFRLSLLTQLGITLAAVFFLLSLPADSKNSLLLGYSLTRLALVAVLLIVGFLIPALPLFSRKIGAAVVDRINRVFSSPWAGKVNGFLLSSILLILLAYQLWAPTVTFTGQIAVLERINPLIFWLTAIIMLSLVSLQSWDGRPQRWLSRFTARIRSFFAKHPSYIYALVCIVVVGFAQLMDQNVISLAEHIRFDNPWGEEWNYWLEETFEMTGSFEMLAAASILLVNWRVREGKTQ